MLTRKDLEEIIEINKIRISQLEVALESSGIEIIEYEACIKQKDREMRSKETYISSLLDTVQRHQRINEHLELQIRGMGATYQDMKNKLKKLDDIKKAVSGLNKTLGRNVEEWNSIQ